jgi:hypothetical protein
MYVKQRVSPDYEEPEKNVADQHVPVVLPTNKARQGENKGYMTTVVTVGTALAILGLAIIFLSYLIVV